MSLLVCRMLPQRSVMYFRWWDEHNLLCHECVWSDRCEWAVIYLMRCADSPGEPARDGISHVRAYKSVSRCEVTGEAITRNNVNAMLHILSSYISSDGTLVIHLCSYFPLPLRRKCTRCRWLRSSLHSSTTEFYSTAAEKFELFDLPDWTNHVLGLMRAAISLMNSLMVAWFYSWLRCCFWLYYVPHRQSCQWTLQIVSVASLAYICKRAYMWTFRVIDKIALNDSNW